MEEEIKEEPIQEETKEEDTSVIDELKSQLEEKDNLLQEKEEEIERIRKGSQDKEMNFAALRKKASEVEKLKPEIDSLKEQIQKVSQQSQQEIIDEFRLENVSDKDDQKMFDHYFALLSSKASNKAEIKKALNDSLVLLNKDKGKEIDPMKKAIPTHGNPGIKQVDSGYDSESSRKMAKKLGIAQDTIDKYKDKVKDWGEIRGEI